MLRAMALLGVSEIRVPSWGPFYKGILLFGDLYWGSPIFRKPPGRTLGGVLARSRSPCTRGGVAPEGSPQAWQRVSNKCYDMKGPLE